MIRILRLSSSLSGRHLIRSHLIRRHGYSKVSQVIFHVFLISTLRTLRQEHHNIRFHRRLLLDVLPRARTRLRHTTRLNHLHTSRPKGHRTITLGNRINNVMMVILAHNVSMISTKHGHHRIHPTMGPVRFRMRPIRVLITLYASRSNGIQSISSTRVLVGNRSRPIGL